MNKDELQDYREERERENDRGDKERGQNEALEKAGERGEMAEKLRDDVIFPVSKQKIPTDISNLTTEMCRR